jgi:hypothetical protein
VFKEILYQIDNPREKKEKEKEKFSSTSKANVSVERNIIKIQVFYRSCKERRKLWRVFLFNRKEKRRMLRFRSALLIQTHIR